MTDYDRKFMLLAIEQAQLAGSIGEVPVGAIITDKDNNLISSGYNLRESNHDPTAHAEIIAIKNAAKKLNSWRLEGTTLYVTIEPCPMCMGAVVLARINRLVFGARDPKAGSVFSLYNIGTDNKLNHGIEVKEGVCEIECSNLVREFFKTLRQ
ncbi:MAG: tRNA adenosine(34) deaminase TadA [Deltaproteobacteria bacterium]|nr:tRNA adenosine(34) deaminase TadA [Deltaproteobacteria bacterium]MCK5709578.1 tRNA adenosine(34) deaminase TadA [Deltaproteobacteria bacterium]